MNERFATITSFALEREVTYDWTNKYAFNPKGRVLWLQRACFWLLRKLKAEWFDTSVTYKRHVIDTDKVIELIQKQHVNLEHMALRRKQPRVIIGIEHYQKVALETMELTPYAFSFRFDKRFGVTRNGVVETFAMDIPVTVVPWIEGCFVMYDDDLR